jgi:hypothetical protein
LVSRRLPEMLTDHVAVFVPDTFDAAELIAIEVAHHAHDRRAFRTRRTG